MSNRIRATVDDRDEIMSVAMAQPHRVGVSPFPEDAWMATALGRFCRLQWNDKDTQKERWAVGERYATLVDSDRIVRGFKPRQCAEAITLGTDLTIDEQYERREEFSQRLKDADEAMGKGESVRLIYRLAYDNLDIWAGHWIAKVALSNLNMYFERLDNPKLARYRGA